MLVCSNFKPPPTGWDQLTAMWLCLTPYTAATELDLNRLAIVGCRIITIKDTLPNAPGSLLSY